MNMSLTHTTRHDIPQRLMRVLVWILAGTYILNCLSPLRMHVDMLRYFAIKDCIEFGCPPDSDAASDYLPYGYTFLLLALSKTGLLKSWVIILINCGYLLGTIILIKRIFKLNGNFLLFTALVLLNWTTIKFTAHPLSELQFLFFSMACLHYFRLYTDKNELKYLLLSVISGGIAFLTRSVGVALAAALVISLLWHHRERILELIRSHRILVALTGVLVLGVILFSRQLGLDHYTRVFNKQFTEGVTFSKTLGWHFTEWTEILTNFSSAKLLPYIRPDLLHAGMIITGVVLFAGLVSVVYILRKSIPSVVIFYLFFYAVLMFNWPFYDPRFWVPVLPLIMAVLVQLPVNRTAVFRYGSRALIAMYMFVGVITVAYFTYTSLNRKVFARTQANGVYRNEYETLFYGKPLSDTAKFTDPVILHVLKRYN